MQRGLVWITSAATTVVLAAGLMACGASVTFDEAGDGKVEVETGPADDSNESVFVFDGDEGSAQLMEDMNSGKMPVSCTVCYDQMGTLPTVTLTDESTIREVYERLACMRVLGESNMSITDNYHYVGFELQDGTKVSFGFEGTGLLSRGRINYEVTDDGNLWEYVRELQDRYLAEHPEDE